LSVQTGGKELRSCPRKKGLLPPDEKLDRHFRPTQGVLILQKEGRLRGEQKGLWNANWEEAIVPHLLEGVPEPSIKNVPSNDGSATCQGEGTLPSLPSGLEKKVARVLDALGLRKRAG